MSLQRCDSLSSRRPITSLTPYGTDTGSVFQREDRRPAPYDSGRLRPDFAFEVDVYVRVIAVGLGLRRSASAESKLTVMWVGVAVFIEKIELASDLK